jgi:uncharacterized membrane protein YkoI
MKLRSFCIVVFAGSFIGAGPAPAQPDAAQPATNATPSQDSLGAGWSQQQDEARRGVRKGRLAPLGTVLEKIRRRVGGHQLDAGLEYQGERPIYRVRWMTRDGRRIDYMIDAASGKMLSGQ